MRDRGFIHGWWLFGTIKPVAMRLQLVVIFILVMRVGERMMLSDYDED